MFQPTRNHSQPDSYYRQDLLAWRLAQLSTKDNLARLTELSPHTIGEALSGKCKKMSTLWRIKNALGLKWEYLFMLDMPKTESEFRRAVEEAVR
jgi:hypothetical protein